jgi:hypothetical protein
VHRIVEPDDDKELFRLMKGNEETGGEADPALFELARGMSTEELAHHVERGRKGVERNRLTLQGIRGRLAIRDDEVSTGGDSSALLPRHYKTRENLVALQRKAQRELKRYEDALRIATTVLSERRR